MNLKRYEKSQSLLQRALKVIPLGSQTFSKSITQYPVGVSPHFLSKGKGAYVWDVDGNQYVDFVNGLLSISLGYNDPDVNAAVHEQLLSGVSFSLAHPIEVQVAEKIVEAVPSAEMVRFGKNGTDATSAAIRLSRAYTNRDRVAVCGYHGWQDWYIGTTSRHLGVPQSVQSLSHNFRFNDASSLETLLLKYPEQFAAVILEPHTATAPEGSFLVRLRELCDRHGTVLIFDEMITGFRLANGGAQELYEVIPDLTCLGKGMANGYPLAAVAGNAEIMAKMEDIFFSGTFGGESLSLAAANACIEKIQKRGICDYLQVLGEDLKAGLNRLIKQHGIAHIIDVSGHPCWLFLVFKDVQPYNQWHARTLFMQEVLRRGILIIGTHNLSYAHTKGDIQSLLTVYDAVFPIIKEAIDHEKMAHFLKTDVLEPLFTLR